MSKKYYPLLRLLDLGLIGPIKPIWHIGPIKTISRSSLIGDKRLKAVVIIIDNNIDNLF